MCQLKVVVRIPVDERGLPRRVKSLSEALMASTGASQRTQGFAVIPVTERPLRLVFMSAASPFELGVWRRVELRGLILRRYTATAMRHRALPFKLSGQGTIPIPGSVGAFLSVLCQPCDDGREGDDRGPGTRRSSARSSRVANAAGI